MTQFFKITLPAFLGVVVQHGAIKLFQFFGGFRSAQRQGFPSRTYYARINGIK